VGVTEVWVVVPDEVAARLASEAIERGTSVEDVRNTGAGLRRPPRPSSDELCSRKDAISAINDGLPMWSLV